MIKRLLLAAACATALGAGATVVDFDKIAHWAGEGDARAALVVLFDGQRTAQVWGYRWDSTAEAQPSAADMAIAVAAASSDLDIMIQWTNFGYTFSGAGYSLDHAAMQYLYYDFEGAADDANISFGYYTPNTGMGQTDAPGADTENICTEAIEQAKTTHVIDHPLDHRHYGYSAYDYDHWQLRDDAPNNILWRSGWYKGYWSFWVGDADLSQLGYSGLGMSSVELADGAVSAWAYFNLDPGSGYGTTEVDWDVELDYEHTDVNTIDTITATTDSDDNALIYSLSGVCLGNLAERRGSLPAGIYIVRYASGTARKVKL